MRQRVNLYPQLPQAKTLLFSAQRVSLLSVTFLALLLFLSLVTRIQMWQRVRTIAELQTQERVITDRLLEYKTHLPELGDKLPMREAVASLQQRLQHRRQIQQHLQSAMSHNVKGFSTYLKDLAQHVVNGVWLTQIDITGNNDDVSLKGNALDTDLVTQYLGVLHNTDNFSGKHFKLLRVKQTQNTKQRYVNFETSTLTHKVTEKS